MQIKTQGRSARHGPTSADKAMQGGVRARDVKYGDPVTTMNCDTGRRQCQSTGKQ